MGIIPLRPRGLGSESRDLRDADSHRSVQVTEGSEERSMGNVKSGENLQFFGLLISRLDS